MTAPNYPKRVSPSQSSKAREDTGGRHGAIGVRVRSTRERRGLSREQLAVNAGVSWSAIAQIETGRRTNLRPGTLVALADALAVSVDYLLGGRGSTPPLLEHRALLYGSDEEFTSTVAPFLGHATRVGDPALVVTTAENIGLLRRNLVDDTSGAQFVERSAWYRAPQATMEEYRSFINRMVDAGANWVVIVGEITWDGRSEEAVRAWGRYETLLNLALASAPATIVCPYDTRVLSADLIDTACATHPELIDSEGSTLSTRYTGLDDLLG